MDLVKYHNDINKIKFNHFKEREIDVLFALMLKAKDSNLENEIVISYAEFNNLIGEEKNKARLKNYILSTSINLKKITQVVELPNGNIEIFGLFDKITIDVNEKNVIFKVNQDFSYMINELLGGEFTLFDLKELVALKGNYPKTLFRLLKQWESTGEYIVKLDEFVDLMGIPRTYKVFTIRQKVFKPCLEELGKYFKNLKITELKKGRNVETLVFTWKGKKEKKKEDIIDIQPVKKKKTALGEKELQEHEKEQLENIVQELEKKKIIKENSLDPVVELIKISKKDYEDLYKDYLGQLGEKHNHFIRKSFDFINKAKYEVIEDMEREQPKEEYIQTKIYTVEDIDERLLVSKTGKKLVGMARQHKIKKLLEDMNKGGQ